MAIHHFMPRNAEGWTADRVNMLKSYSEAKRAFGSAACMIAKGHNVYWCAADAADYFADLLTKEGVEIIARHDAKSIKSTFSKEPTRFNENGLARVRHPKFGEGSVIHGAGTDKLLVQFAKDKPMRIAASSVEAVE